MSMAAMAATCYAVSNACASTTRCSARRHPLATKAHGSSLSGRIFRSPSLTRSVLSEGKCVSITTDASDAQAVAGVPYMPLRRGIITMLAVSVPLVVPGIHGWAADAIDVEMIPDADDDLAVKVFQVGKNCGLFENISVRTSHHCRCVSGCRVFPGCIFRPE